MRDMILVETIHDEVVIVARDDYANPALTTLDICTHKGVRLKETAAVGRGETVEVPRSILRRALPSVCGHRVETRHTSPQVPYELHGPKGAVYLLLRNEKDRHMLFAVKTKGGYKCCKVNGVEWFSDATGEVLPLRDHADFRRHQGKV